jgi:DNA polymerase III subunit delta'
MGSWPYYSQPVERANVTGSKNVVQLTVMTAWDNIVGHNWATELLQSAIQHQRMGHAYLISGPAQIGKTTLARTFAQALNCTHSESQARPCGTCRSCQLISADRHPDVLLLEPQISGRGRPTILIEQIRDLQQQLNLTATEARYKVAILARFEAAYPGAANAFLKTLEEPPADVILILTTSDAEALLPTITSRCRTISLRPVASELIHRALIEKWQVPDEKAKLLAHLADGRLGWAINTAQDESILSERDVHLDHLSDILQQKRYQRFQMAEKLARKPEELPALLRTWLGWWHDLALMAIGIPDSVTITNIDHHIQLDRLSHQLPESVIVTSLRQTDKALWQLERNANTRLVLENLFLVYPLR